ncbi:MAG: hypothetical protein ABFS02_06055, partial [Pseudomonadota bacterium]
MKMKKLLLASLLIGLSNTAFVDTALAKKIKVKKCKAQTADVVLTKGHPDFDANNPDDLTFFGVELPVPPAGLVIVGTNRANVITGTDGDDTI